MGQVAGKVSVLTWGDLLLCRYQDGNPGTTLTGKVGFQVTGVSRGHSTDAVTSGRAKRQGG
jgi:hypothetical protein